MTSSRQRWLVLGVLAAGAALLVLAGGQPWVVVRTAADPPLPGRTVALAGRALAPGAAALGWATLAAAAALLLVRSWGRIALGALVAFGGLLAGYVTAAGSALPAARAVVGPASSSVPDSFARTGWPFVAYCGAALIVVGGAAVVARARRWPGPAARYERPSSGADAPRTSWQALDRGEDPTLGQR